MAYLAYVVNNPLEQRAMEIAKDHLGSSFDIGRSNGFRTWRQTQAQQTQAQQTQAQQTQAQQTQAQQTQAQQTQAQQTPQPQTRKKLGPG